MREKETGAGPDLRQRQAEALAVLARSASSVRELQPLFDLAVETVPGVFDADYCKVLQLWPNGEQLLLRAGRGWMDGLVGHESVGADWDSQAGYTLLQNHPIIVEELSREERFHGPPLLLAHHVVSGISVVIPGEDGPFGVLGVHLRTLRHFDELDAAFVQAAGNLLGIAVARIDAPAIEIAEAQAPGR